MWALLSCGLRRPRVVGDRVAHARDRRRPVDGAPGPGGTRGAGAGARTRHARRRGAGGGLQLLLILMVRGQYQVKPAFPFIPGAELAGVVRAVRSEEHTSELQS